jgi:3-methyl-2-oxobutanoate hydroxymethyltransferase
MEKCLDHLLSKKKNHFPITMVTAYDFPTAQIADEADVDAILVGDSVGTNMLGYTTEREVSMEDMLHHSAAVARGTKNAFLLADLPFRSADTPLEAEKNCRKFMETGIQCVKCEGWMEKCGVVEYLSGKNIPVCAHIGYNPQIHGAPPRVFGATAEEAFQLIESAQLLEKAGAVLCIIEKVTEEVAGIITQKLRIPTIGIGSGRLCNGQVLVINDLLGISAKTYKHARRFLDFHALAFDAIKTFSAEVKNGTFPAEKHLHHINQVELKHLSSLQ